MSMIGPDRACEDARHATRIRRVEAVLASMRALRSPRPGDPAVAADLEHTIAGYERELAILERRLRVMQR